MEHQEKLWIIQLQKNMVGNQNEFKKGLKMTYKDFLIKFNNENIVITGGAGFVGSNLIHLLIKKTKFNIISIDIIQLD